MRSTTRPPDPPWSMCIFVNPHCSSQVPPHSKSTARVPLSMQPTAALRLAHLQAEVLALQHHGRHQQRDHIHPAALCRPVQGRAAMHIRPAHRCPRCQQQAHAAGMAPRRGMREWGPAVDIHQRALQVQVQQPLHQLCLPCACSRRMQMKMSEPIAVIGVLAKHEQLTIRHTPSRRSLAAHVRPRVCLASRQDIAGSTSAWNVR